MSQLLGSREELKHLFNVMRNAKAQTMSIDIVKMYSEIIGSKKLGELLFDNGLIDFGFEIDRQFFVDNYLAILEVMTKSITLDTHRTLIKSLLGEEVEVAFTIPNPGHLIVNINEQKENYGLISPNGYGISVFSVSKIGAGWAVKVDKGLQTRSNKGFAFKMKSSAGILLSTVTSNYTIEQARNLLKNITTAGVFTEFNFNITAV